MADFVPCRVMVDVAQRKHVKYMAKCAAIVYGFLSFSFSSFRELEEDAVTLLKWIQKFSMVQDIGGRAAVHIFNRISFAIAKGVGAQIVSRLPSNLLWNFVTPTQLDYIMVNTPYGRIKIKDSFSLSLHAWYLDDGTIIRDTLVVGKVLELIMKDGPRCGLHLNLNKTKRVAKSIKLMDVVAKLNDPQCELLLLRACAGISKLHFAMHTCSPHIFKQAQHSFDAALRSSLTGIVTASGPGFGDWQWWLATLPFSCGGLGVYSACDVLRYAFLASRLQSASLQTKLLRHSDIVSSRLAFDNALNAFNVKMDIDLLSIEVFMGDINRDHAVSCAVRISAGKEVDIGLGGGRDKFLRPADMLLYSWDGGLDYEANCADIGYGFLPFSFSSFGELEKDAVTLLKRIRKFSVAQSIRARAAIHIFSRINFAIARGVRAQIVSPLPTNFL
ncbi:hypothetical protein Tco_0933008 [Tanacetum coccineum]